MSKQIFFIVGSGRCGTQMLSAMLNKYPDIYITPESHFIPVAIEELGIHNVLLDDFLSLIQRDSDWRNQRPWIETMIKHSDYCFNIEYFSAKLYDRLGKKADLRDIIDQVFAILSGSKTIVGDKTPFYGCFMSSLLQLWPEAKFIYLTRHPEDCAKSMQKHPGFRRVCAVGGSGKELTRYRYGSITLANTSDHELSLEQAKRFWFNLNSEIQQEKENIPTSCILTLRYEDLVAYPVNTLSTIETFLELPKTPLLKKIYAVSIPRWNLSFRGQSSLINEENDLLKMSHKLNYPVVPSFNDQVKHLFSELFRVPAIAYIYIDNSNMKLTNKVKNKIKNQLKKIIKNNKKLIEKLTDSHIFFVLPRGIHFFYDISKSFPKYQINTIFDVGANLGQSSRFYLNHFPNSEIYCFEPVKDSFTQLQQNLKDDERVHCYQLALSSVKRNAKMAIQGTSDMFSLLDDSNELLEQNNEIATESVELVTLDEFCDFNQIDYISYLKIDTEGEDLEVLKGSKKMLAEQKIDLVEVEAGMNPSNERHVPGETLKAFLESYGYFLFGIYKQMYEWPTKKPYLRRSNLLFISARMAKIK